jgi:hypothetical protein
MVTSWPFLTQVYKSDLRGIGKHYEVGEYVKIENARISLHQKQALFLLKDQPS